MSLAVAGVADSLNVAFPVLFLPVGILTALILLALWGLRWEVAVAVIPELIPGVAMFPSWVLLVCYLAGVKPKTQKKEIQKSDKKSDNW